MRGTTLQSIVSDPEHARLICGVLSELELPGFPARKSYQVLRQLKPEELYRIYNVFCREGKQRYKEEFGPIYHQVRGDSIGPLFAPFGM